VITVLLEAQSPRLSDISEKIDGQSSSCYKTIQRFWFVTYSPRTIRDQATSRNQEHFRCFAAIKQLLGERPLVLDREFSYTELMEILTLE